MLSLYRRHQPPCSYRSRRYQIADAIDIVLHLERRRGTRVVEELISVGRYEAERDRYETNVLHRGQNPA